MAERIQYRNVELMRAIQHLLGLLWLHEAGTRRMTPSELEITDQLLSWYDAFKGATRGPVPPELANPALNTDCSNCGTSDDVCWRDIQRKGQPCCGPCQHRKTHNQNQPGYVDPWRKPGYNPIRESR